MEGIFILLSIVCEITQSAIFFNDSMLHWRNIGYVMVMKSLSDEIWSWTSFFLIDVSGKNSLKNIYLPHDKHLIHMKVLGFFCLMQNTQCDLWNQIARLNPSRWRFKCPQWHTCTVTCNWKFDLDWALCTWTP